MSLWLCCDYDLSYEEERRAGAVSPEAGSERARHEDDFEVDYHLHNPIRMDKLTRPEEPWFEHLKQFVDQGVSAFKMDGASQVNEHPDRKWGNGMDDEEMHNLYPTLLNKQMHLGFAEHTGRRPMIYSSGGYAGIQRYAATWAGDTGGGPRPLVSMLNHGMSGHVNTSCDMDVFTPAGIHFGFLQAWSQVCSWAYWRHPWLLGEELLAVFQFYARFRYRLLPYIYSTAHVAAQTGMPIMRAMPLLFPEDPRSDELVQQYMLGDAFLTAAFADEIRLPRGTWIDVWTGQAYVGPRDVPVEFPEDRGGPLFVRDGAIVPTWPEMDYVGQRPVDKLGLEVYLNKGDVRNTFSLYEDDGETFGYLEGQVARTRIACERRGNETTVCIGPREGAYDGMPAERSYDVSLYVTAPPTRVWVNDRPVEQGEGASCWRYEKSGRALCLTVAEDPERREALVVRCI
jgi:alpha-glucosidase (family GH31 glycosyl hydrolase)